MDVIGVVTPLVRDPSTRQSVHLSASLESSAISSGLEFLLVLLASFPAAMSFPDLRV